jgi:hypothetical protein
MQHYQFLVASDLKVRIEHGRQYMVGQQYHPRVTRIWYHELLLPLVFQDFSCGIQIEQVCSCSLDVCNAKSVPGAINLGQVVNQEL